jgi:hypothetical protein
MSPKIRRTLYIDPFGGIIGDQSLKGVEGAIRENSAERHPMRPILWMRGSRSQEDGNGDGRHECLK